jgi:hypothetical protein
MEQQSENLPIGNPAVIALAEAVLAKARAGEIISLVYCAERTDGYYEHNWQDFSNVYTVAGMLFHAAMRATQGTEGR